MERERMREGGRVKERGTSESEREREKGLRSEGESGGM